MSRRGTHSGKDGQGAGVKRRRGTLIVIEVMCIIVVVIAGIYLFQQYSRYYLADRDFQEVAKETESSPTKAKKYNADCVGWIRVKDTRIDYPVMYTTKDPEYYLHRNFKGEYSFAGTPFMGEGSQPDDPKANSQIIYAHHMRDGSMFGQLERFSNRDWAQSHAIEFTTDGGKTKYRAFAAMYVDLSGSAKPYEYWNQVGELSKDTFKSFVKDVNARSLYNTKYKAKYGQKIMMLSTCSYGTSEQRFVVFGVTTD